MKIEAFGVERWMSATETRCELNLAETCVHSLTIAELLALAGKTEEVMAAELARMRLTYGPITGSLQLRERVAARFDARGPDEVLITHGTIGANHMVYQTLVEAGDEVIAIVPTYQQHTAIPRSLGARVHELPLREPEGWTPDLDRLAALVSERTRVIALTNPNNPTGALSSPAALDRIIELARRVGAWVLCDEVYRGTEQVAAAPAIADRYERGISTGGMSKAFSLAGLRLGWIVGSSQLLDAAELHRDYTTISVGMIDDYFATIALGVGDQLLARARKITGANLRALASWLSSEPRVDAVLPQAGTTALLRYALDLPSRELCERLLADTGVLLTPGSAMGMEGYVRVGFANDAATLSEGLARVSGWLADASPTVRHHP